MARTPRTTTWTRSLLSLMLAAALLAVSAGSADAQEIVYGSTVPAGTTVDQDIILTGDEVTIDGTVLGDVVALGGKVVVNGRVEGTLIAVAQDIELNGAVGGSLLAAALQLLSGPEASIGKNLYFGGLSLVLPQGATVGRDLVAATMGATMGGEVARDVKAIIGPFEFARLLIGAAEEGDWLGKAQAWWESVRPQPAPQPLPTVPPPSSSIGSRGLMRIHQAPQFKATPTPAPTVVPQTTPGAPTVEQVAKGGPAVDDALGWLRGRALAFIPMAFYGLVALWLFPASIVASAERLRRKPWPTSLWGFLVFVVANQLFVVAGILAILVVVLGLALGLQSMWGFGFSIWAIGLPGIALTAALLAVALYVLSGVITSFAVLSHVLKPGEQYLSRAGVMLLGVLVLVVLAGIPVLGSIVWIVAMAVGSGALFFAYTDALAARRRLALAEVAPKSPGQISPEPAPMVRVKAAAATSTLGAPVSKESPPAKARGGVRKKKGGK